MKILVTGSASGLGAALAFVLRQNGHEVVEFDQEYGDDVRRPSYSDDLAAKIEGLDGLINCAGINLNQWFEEVTLGAFRRVMEVNAYSFVNMTQWCLEELIKSKGFVINIVSNAAHIPMTSSLAYNASKAAGLMITKQMAHELTPKHGITVFSVSPNKLKGTGMSKQIEDNVCKVRGWTPEYAAEYQKKALMHGLESPPETLAEFIAGLLDSGAWKYMSGTDVPFGK
jgi:NAD(P)-dependent dehydrogenase (short-subunit alcohol dehydrogenase family)